MMNSSCYFDAYRHSPVPLSLRNCTRQQPALKHCSYSRTSRYKLRPLPFLSVQIRSIPCYVISLEKWAGSVDWMGRQMQAGKCWKMATWKAKKKMGG